MRNLNFQEYSHIIKALLIFIWIPALHYGQTADVVQGPSGITHGLQLGNLTSSSVSVWVLNG